MNLQCIEQMQLSTSLVWSVSPKHNELTVHRTDATF